MRATIKLIIRRLFCCHLRWETTYETRAWWECRCENCGKIKQGMWQDQKPVSYIGQ